MSPQTCALGVLFLLICAVSHAAVLPPDKPGMAVRVEAGEYTVRGQIVKVPKTVELAIPAVDKSIVKGEEHVMSDEQAATWHLGTALKGTLGPVDIYTRLPYAIDPVSVTVHSEKAVYEENKDYSLDHDWGGISRIETGSIPKDGKVYVDYEVYLQRVDAIQVSAKGAVSVKKGKAASVNAEIPEADKGCTAIANVYIPYRTAAVTAENIYPLPSRDLAWQSFIKVSGRKYLSNTLGLLKSGKPVTVVCWGDSVTSGGSPSSHDKCYVELFRAHLKQAYPNAKITLINAGIGGSNTDSRRGGYDTEVLAHNPDLITVEYVNDAGMSAEQIKANWSEFITRARAKNPKVEFILLTPHYIVPQWMGSYKDSIPAMRRSAWVNKVALGDTTNVWAHLRDIGMPYMTLEANGINHPNDLGHEFFTTTLMRLLSPKSE